MKIQKTGPLSLTVTTDRVQTVSVTTIEDTKTGPLSLTVTTDRVQTVSVTTIEDTKTGPPSLTVTTVRVQTVRSCFFLLPHLAKGHVSFCHHLTSVVC